MKRQQIILIVCGVLLLAACGGAGWFLFSAMTVRRAAERERNDGYSDVRKRYNAKVFPSAENIQRVKQDEVKATEWLVAASNLIHAGDISVDQYSPTAFKQLLQTTVRNLSGYAGSVNGKVVAEPFYFGFDNYLGESDSLPTAANVKRLTEQLVTVEMISKELFAAKINQLTEVRRETFDMEGGAASGSGGGDDDGSSRRRFRRGASRDTAETAVQAEKPEFYTRHRFTFGFTAKPAAFIDALNRLAAMKPFVVVSEVAFQKTSDPLSQLQTKKTAPRTGAQADAAAGDLTAAASNEPKAHVDRIVSDPAIEPPVSVKLVVDIVTFEGV